ncbi:MAG TPA: LCP family protein [Epulopiscium sp.]|nr:LCP family protein [Candidatus Epulonipiscium sp.]
MSSRKPKLKKGARKRLIRRFITIMLSTFVIGTGVVLGGLATYQHLSKDGNMFDGFPKLSAGEKKNTEEKEEKLKTNVAVFGVDIEGYRTDIMFVVHFDGETNSADLVSVPRDTIVKLSDTELEKMRKINRGTPKTMKINEMTAYAGIKNINEFTVKQIERTLGIKIDNYVTVEIDAFRKIVDQMGGVTVDVPRRMRYDDNSQKLHIDLQPGIQLLDGANAEGLVRFRKGKDGSGYRDGDTGRIETQHIFLKAFAQQLLSKENIPNLPKMIPAMFQHVKTDINILDLPKYYGYATNFDTNAINFYTIPGEGRYQGSVSYFFPEMNEMDSFVQDIFYKKPVIEGEQLGQKEIVDKTVQIEILNGGAPAGTAAKLKEVIGKDGYEVVRVANYTGEDIEEVTIFARDTSQAEQFKRYFDNCTITMDSSIKKGVDIQIVIGTKGI